MVPSDVGYLFLVLVMERGSYVVHCTSLQRIPCPPVGGLFCYELVLTFEVPSIHSEDQSSVVLAWYNFVWPLILHSCDYSLQFMPDPPVLYSVGFDVNFLGGI